MFQPQNISQYPCNSALVARIAQPLIIESALGDGQLERKNRPDSLDGVTKHLPRFPLHHSRLLFNEQPVPDTESDLPLLDPTVEHRHDQHRHDFDGHAAETGNSHRHHDVCTATG